MDYEELKSRVPGRLRNITVLRGPGVQPNGKVAIGFGLLDTVGQEALRLGAGKILLVTDRILSGFGMAELVEARLQKQGLSVEIFDDVAPEPQLTGARKVQDLVRSGDFKVVIGLGGGSVLDIAKTAAISATNRGDIQDYLTGVPFESPGIPSILLPTTSGTGSEVSPYIVLSDSDRKVFGGSPFLLATVALVDPLLTVTMPPFVTAATGLDALSHGVEGVEAMSNPFTEALSARCVELVFGYLVRAFEDGEDLDARYHMSFASVMGMMAYAQGGGLYAHSLSYVLTMHHKDPHGIGCGLALPYTLMYNADTIRPLLRRFAGAIDAAGRGAWGDARDDAGEDNYVRNTVLAFRDLLVQLQVPTNLGDLGLGEEKKQIFSDELVGTYARPKNPRKLGPADAARLIDCMWSGLLEDFQDSGATQ